MLLTGEDLGGVLVGTLSEYGKLETPEVDFQRFGGPNMLLRIKMDISPFGQQ
jgi:hypothetical protein